VRNDDMNDGSIDMNDGSKKCFAQMFESYERMFVMEL